MGSPKSAPKAKWDLKKDTCLVELLLAYTRVGEKSDSGFKGTVWNAVATAFGEKWPKLKPKQLQCRTQIVCFACYELVVADLQLTANYKIFQALVNNSGFGWDDENKLNTAPESVWDDYIEASSTYGIHYAYKLETSESCRVSIENVAIVCRAPRDIWNRRASRAKSYFDCPKTPNCRW
jgi:hypothetical protein